MTDTREAWNAVSDRLSTLALKLKLHAEEEINLEDTDGLAKVRAAITDAFEAVGDAYSDVAVREDAREAAKAFIAAMDATAHDVHGRLRPRS